MLIFFSGLFLSFSAFTILITLLTLIILFPLSPFQRLHHPVAADCRSKPHHPVRGHHLRGHRVLQLRQPDLRLENGTHLE